LPEDSSEGVPIHAVDFTGLNDFLCSSTASIGGANGANEDFWSTLFTMQQETY
jgi:hypothetical protein